MGGVTAERHRPESGTDAFVDLYRERYGPMVRLAYLMTGSNEAAEELVQEAFVKVHRNWDRAHTPVAYLRTAVVNQCRSWHRRRYLDRDRRARIGRQEAQGLEADEMWDALAELRPRQRAALVLKFYEGLPEAEIAEALGVRPGTVKSLVHRGLEQLRKVVER